MKKNLLIYLVLLCVSAIATAQQTTETGDENEEALLPPKKEVSSSPRAVEEVYVTSNKMGSASLQEMPVAVKLLTSDELLRRGISEFIDFAGSIPSLQYQDLGPGDKEYIIRGTNSSGPSTVGVYFGETPITGSNAQDGGGRNVEIKLVDLQTIEIFNGPQGTQYGANSMSGLVRYVPKMPETDEFSANIDLDTSSTDNGGLNYSYSGVVNVPIVENILAARLVAWSTQNDGWIDQSRVLGGEAEDINDEDTVGGRLMVRFLPTDSLMVDFMYLKQSLDLGGSSRYTPKGADIVGMEGSAFPPGTATDDYQNTDLGKSPWSEELDVFELTMNYEFEFGTLIGTSSSYKRDIEFSFDASALAFALGLPLPWAIVEPQVRDVSFSEIRFTSDLDGSLQFLVGASLRHEDNDWQAYGVTYDASGNDTAFVPGAEHDFLSNITDFATLQSTGNVLYQRFINFELEQNAIFGELLYEVSDKLTLTVGARNFSSEQSAEEGSIHPEPSDVAFNESDDSKVTGKFSAAYQYDSNKNFYATVSQGFRVGGLNNSESLGTNSPIPVSYASDFLTSYELGFKTKLFDESVTFNGAFYHIDWEDMQIEVTEGSVPYITNAGEAGINGVELNVSSYVTNNLLLEFAGSFTDAKLTKDQPRDEDDLEEDLERGLKGDRIPNVPKIQFYTALTYDHLTPLGTLEVRGDITYRGKTDIQFSSRSDFSYELDESFVASLRAIMEFKDDWTATLYIRNLTNTKTEYDAIYSDQDPLAVVGAKPMTVGLRVQKQL